MAIVFVIALPLAALLASLLVKKSMQILSFIAVCASLIELLATIDIVIAVIKNGTYSFTGYFSIDALGSILMLLLATIGAMASFYSAGYLKIEIKKEIIGFSRVRQYWILLHLFILAMFFAIITTVPILMWIAIEATTLSTVFLISFYAHPSTVEAAWKYLIINSVGLLLGLFGTLLFLYPAIRGGFEGLANWQTLLSNTSFSDPTVTKIAFIFVLIGFGTKVGLVPMHTWLPDAHSKAPAPISSLLSGILLNIAFLAILRFKVVVDSAIGNEFTGYLLVLFGLLSIVVAAFIIFTQKNYKRLLAYHSIEHMGIIALGFGLGGVGAFAALLHLIYHALAKSALFLSAGNIILKYSSTKIINVKGMIKTIPVTSILFFIGFLAMAGVPPFGIFITEFSILSAGMKVSPIITIVALISLVIVFAGIIKHVADMIFGEPKKDISQGENGVGTIVPIALLTIIFIFLSLFIPTELRLLLHSATISY